MTAERFAELGIRTLGVVVVVSVALALAALTWRLTGWDDGREAIAPATNLPARTTGPDPDVARIVAFAPFGGGAGADGLPTSTLGLVLKGVLMAYPPEASLALIATGEGPATAFGVGASPAGNAVIESIALDHVILKVGDRRELLAFPEPAPGTAAPNASATPGAGITITTPNAPVATQTSPAAAAALASASPIASAAAQSRAAPPIIASPAITAGAMGVSATAEGYRIGANPAPELRRFGLQSGDVIETLNGETVGDLSSDRQLFERAAQSGAARVEVVRNGRRMTLTLPLR